MTRPVADPAGAAVDAVRVPLLRVEYVVVVDLPGGRRTYRVRAWDLDDLGDVIEREVRAAHRGLLARVRLDGVGMVHARVGAGSWQEIGMWERAL